MIRIIIIKEPWATPNRATAKSCHPFKKCLKASKKQFNNSNINTKQSLSAKTTGDDPKIQNKGRSRRTFLWMAAATWPLSTCKVMAKQKQELGYSMNVDKAIINHPFGNGLLYHLFMVFGGMVYYFTHITPHSGVSGCL